MKIALFIGMMWAAVTFILLLLNHGFHKHPVISDYSRFMHGTPMEKAPMGMESEKKIAGLGQ